MEAGNFKIKAPVGLVLDAWYRSHVCARGGAMISVFHMAEMPEEQKGVSITPSHSRWYKS